MRLLSIIATLSVCCFSLFAGWVYPAAAQTPQCNLTNNTLPPLMTIVIINNSPQTIYPVLSSGTGGVAEDNWMEACFGNTQAQINAGQKYPRGAIYRFYINPSQGIAPQATVTVTLPIYSALNSMPNATAPGQFIDWWQGGRVEIFVNPTYLNMALSAEKTPITPVNTGGALIAPSCVPMGCNLSFFASTDGIPTALPSQLTEFTFGAKNPCFISTQVNAGTACPTANSGPLYVLDAGDVDIDVSYVDATFLPVVMEPYANPGDQTGWVGISLDFPTFTTGFKQWVADMVTTYGATTADPMVSWPQLGLCLGSGCAQNSTVNTKVPKLPSAIHIMGYNVFYAPYPNFPSDVFPPQAPPPPLTKNPPFPQPNPPPWPSILKLDTSNPPKQLGGLIANYNACVGTNKAIMPPPPNCPMLMQVIALFQANYENYNWTFGTAGSGCTLGPKLVFNPATNPYPLIKHVYAWTAFQENCNSDFNPLYFTPGYCTAPGGGNCSITTVGPIQTKYQAVKTVYDHLQYNGTPFQTNIPIVSNMFDPYVALIHGQKYLNSLNAYAYSVDDDVGNFQGKGTGAYIAVGGTAGLPNTNAAALPVKVNFAAVNLANNVAMKTYSICNTSPQNTYTVVPSFASFVIGAYVNYVPQNCPVYFKDSQGTQYTFTITKPPPYGPRPTTVAQQDKSMIDCSKNTGAIAIAWCGLIFGFTSYDGGATQTQENTNIQVPGANPTNLPP
jgi:hypothetical protein